MRGFCGRQSQKLCSIPPAGSSPPQIPPSAEPSLQPLVLDVVEESRCQDGILELGHLLPEWHLGLILGGTWDTDSLWHEVAGKLLEFLLVGS